ncbi:hypothetical protein KY360_06435 [Candidatus Woesearchaeota archaeon]|nr:hypothetical protein [Candidatus Woesearchaeota archaeon]
MKLRKRAIGDLYLAASVIFIYLAFLYFGFKANGWPFLVIGLLIATFGIKTKKVMVAEEGKPKKAKSRKKK